MEEAQSKGRQRKWLSRLIDAALLVFVIAALVAHYRSWQHNEAVIGQTLSPHQLTTLVGEDMELPFNKQPQVVLFWATWCGPCTTELAWINDAVAAGDIAAEQVVAIAVDDNVETVRATAEEREYAFQVYIDHSGQLSRTINLQSTPTVVFHDANGSIVEVDSGLNPLVVRRIRSFLERQKS